MSSDPAANTATFEAQLLLDTFRGIDLGTVWLDDQACIVLANIFGLLIHLAVERPLIRAFRRFNFGADNKLQPQVSGVEP